MCHQEVGPLIQSLGQNQQWLYGYSQTPIEECQRGFTLDQEAALIHGCILLMRIGPKASESTLMKQLAKDKLLQQQITIRNQKTSYKLLEMLSII